MIRYIFALTILVGCFVLLSKAGPPLVDGTLSPISGLLWLLAAASFVYWVMASLGWNPDSREED